jgi:hypothetical protein
MDPLKYLDQTFFVREVHLHPRGLFDKFLWSRILTSISRKRGELNYPWRTLRERRMISCLPVAIRPSIISRATSAMQLVSKTRQGEV